MRQIVFAALQPQTPLWELTALPQDPQLDLRGRDERDRKGRGEGKGWNWASG